MWNNCYTPLPLISKLPAEWILYDGYDDNGMNDAELFGDSNDFSSSLSKTYFSGHQDELSKDKDDDEDLHKKQNTEKEEGEEGDKYVVFKPEGTNISAVLYNEPNKKEHKHRRLKCHHKSECEVIRKIANRMTANTSKDDNLFFPFKRDSNNVKTGRHL